MMLVTNTSDTPKGVFIGGAIKFWSPGEVKELALSEADVLEVRGTEGLTVQEDEPVSVEVVKPAKAQKATQ